MECPIILPTASKKSVWHNSGLAIGSLCSGAPSNTTEVLCLVYSRNLKTISSRDITIEIYDLTEPLPTSVSTETWLLHVLSNWKGLCKHIKCPPPFRGKRLPFCWGMFLAEVHAPHFVSWSMPTKQMHLSSHELPKYLVDLRHRHHHGRRN